MPVAPKSEKIDELMKKASESLARMAYFEAERMASKALAMSRQDDDFDQMARIVMPLMEARRHRLQQALDVKHITILDAELSENMKIKPGCFLVQPPLVGADARRFRLEALHREIPVAVLCREPITQLGFCPIVAIGPSASIRTKIDPPDDLDHPDLAWFADALTLLGGFALQSLDPEMAPLRYLDAILDFLDTFPEHEGLHQALEQACKDAQRDMMDQKPKSSSRTKK